MNTVGEGRSGFSSVLTVKCTHCGSLNKVNTSSQHRAGTRGPLASDVNTRAVLGSLHIGIGQTQLNNLFTTLNVPPMSNVLFKRREREIGNAVENVVKKSCKQILEQEKKKAEEKSQNQGGEDGLVGIAVSYDMGWQKRGKGHNSLTGHGTAMGLVTGKVLSYSTRCKSCRVCDSSNRSGTAVKNHDCRKNHTGSSKSMERDVRGL